ncbi:MAG TPA: metallophosphoesterase, partial [Vicinamibacterales bacterium]|nr:metallophosphoesterase [Vicinamibacterales bacterium]
TSSHHFEFVIMLGDNLYTDDYQSEFLTPYKALLDRGVSFYASLGNHDRDLEEHFKPFNMNDHPYYTFTKGNARFVALNSNRPTDPAQYQWLDHAYGDTTGEWRIAFFHHPLYSSGEHAAESREEIRPALEPHLLQNKVDVVFGGHEHLYERVAPQQDVHYFVSGGGGKTLYGVHKSPFDEVAVSAHHFMVLALAGDAMYYEAVTPEGPLLDCGVIWRTKDAETKGPDDKGRTWLSACTGTIAKTRPAGQR